MTKLPPQALSNEVNVGVFVGGLTGSLRPCSKSEINERGDLRDYSEAKEMQAMLSERPSSENRDDIIRMAREAELHCHIKLTEHGLIIEDLQYFANLVATAERKRCAQIVQSYMDNEYIDDPGWDVARDILNDIQAEEEK